MRFLPVNETIFLTELADLDETLALFDSLNANPIDGVEELVPAARTIMVYFNPIKITAQNLISQIKQRDLSNKRAKSEQIIEIAVRYDGEDLEEVADYLQLSIADLIARHKNAEFTVAFTGFAPGFAYMTSSDALFDVPRKKTPRTRIPAGSLGLAGRFSGIYPQATPGGWQLIGTTDTPMFDINRNPASLLKPGDRVRFIEQPSKPIAVKNCDNQATLTSTDSRLDDNVDSKAAKPLIKVPLIQVKQCAFALYFEDNGRIHQASQGISPSGALDKGAFKAINKIVGNDDNDPVLEIVFGGVEFEILSDTVIAFSGADCPVTLTAQNGRAIKLQANQPIGVEKGDILTIAPANSGLRLYFTVRGGFDVAKIMNSSSRDILANIGPEPVKTGDVLFASGKRVQKPVELGLTPAFAMPKAGDVVDIDVVLGPRTDWFTLDAIEVFLNQKWQVTPQSDRVGNRLNGEQALSRKILDELPSEGTATGAIQVPASGQPVLFLADHPLTGGYPVIACVANHHLDLAGQLPAGCFIQFKVVNSQQAFAEML
ncbi:urea amidolyase family protein (plasmid) [Bartonella sp. HY329]|uniref:5-oxoprolinase subunit B/C family protein n=1 Tax=unclassified Bartonella TaxID=2645622 RepID=UPI0021C9E074|nr:MULTISPECIES: urea amidolyase family protein [unclassified Bartonella]UXM96616.1 urea amidolyase family protein [Bartonella sp. HY329]UXN10939.1 urea amidolyase family protein [Bartonella sp. HY328]